MTKRVLVSFILPHTGTDAEVVQTLRSLKPFADEIQLVSARGIPPVFEFAQIAMLDGEPPHSPGELINRALQHILGKYMAVLPPGVELVSNFGLLARRYFTGSPQANYLYGNYLQRQEDGTEELIQVNPCPDDVTEREDWGPLEFYRVSTLRELGGCDASVRFRHDYDLRLKVAFARPGIRIAEPLCSVPYRAAEAVASAEALFYPGRGKFGGFSYLFMDPEEEKEIEEIFYRALKRHGAYLEDPSGAIFPEPTRTSPRVSVIVPVHNRARFLPLAVRSVLRGEFRDFEIIVVDNASEDETLGVAQSLAEQDARIRVINLGDNVIARALNEGVRQARGEYIAQLDSDDEYAPDTLKGMVQALDERRDWALAISYYDLMDEAGNPLQEFGVIKHLEYNRNNILRVDGAGAVRVWRKAAIQEFGGFNQADFGHYGEDYDLVLKVSEKYEVGRVHQVLYHYRRHPGNSDALRPHELKIRNKTLARRRAIERRQAINRQR